MKVIRDININGIVGTLTSFHESVPSQKSILFIPGWKRDKSDHAARSVRLSHYGWDCLSIDLPGFGKSPGDLSTITPLDHLRAVRDAFDHLSESSEDITVISSSYSSLLALLLTNERKVTSLVLRAPTLYTDADLEKSKEERNSDASKEFRMVVRCPSESYILKLAQSYTGNALLVESGMDNVISPETIQSYVLSFSSGSVRRFEHKVMIHASHSLEGERLNHEFTNLLVNWLLAIELSK